MTGKIARLLPRQMVFDDFVARTLQGVARRENLTLTQAWDFLAENAYINAGFDLDGLDQAVINIGRPFIGATMATNIVVPPGQTLETAKPPHVPRTWEETLKMLERARSESVLSADPF